MARTRINPISKKRLRVLRRNDGYQNFSKRLREQYPRCQIAWPGHCTGNSQGVHHVIKLSKNGALKPGPLADAQGQVFLASCNSCNQAVEDFPIDARIRGLTKDNPLDATDLSTRILYADAT